MHCLTSALDNIVQTALADRVGPNGTTRFSLQLYSKIGLDEMIQTDFRIESRPQIGSGNIAEPDSADRVV